MTRRKKKYKSRKILWINKQQNSKNNSRLFMKLHKFIFFDHQFTKNFNNSIASLNFFFIKWTFFPPIRRRKVSLKKILSQRWTHAREFFYSGRLMPPSLTRSPRRRVKRTTKTQPRQKKHISLVFFPIFSLSRFYFDFFLHYCDVFRCEWKFAWFGWREFHTAHNKKRHFKAESL